MRAAGLSCVPTTTSAITVVPSIHHSRTSPVTGGAVGEVAETHTKAAGVLAALGASSLPRPTVRPADDDPAVQVALAARNDVAEVHADVAKLRAGERFVIRTIDVEVEVQPARR